MLALARCVLWLLLLPEVYDCELLLELFPQEQRPLDDELELFPPNIRNMGMPASVLYAQ